jgi:asparagine synthase (glutamine-hydrolysing)
MFRAPFAATFLDDPPPYVHQLMSEESLRKTGYFDVANVRRHFAGGAHAKEGKRSYFAGMGLATIVATQLWHHTYLGGGLCELPALEFKAPRALALAGE